MYVTWRIVTMHTDTTPLRGVPIALFLTRSSNVRDSNTSNPKRQENAFCMYVSPPRPITQGAFSIGKNAYKGKKKFWKPKDFQKKMLEMTK